MVIFWVYKDVDMKVQITSVNNSIKTVNNEGKKMAVW